MNDTPQQRRTWSPVPPWWIHTGRDGPCHLLGIIIWNLPKKYHRYAYSSKIHHIKLLIKHLQPSKGQVYTCTYMYTASVNGKRNKGIPECNNFFNLHIHVYIYIYIVTIVFFSTLWLNSSILWIPGNLIIGLKLWLHYQYSYCPHLDFLTTLGITPGMILSHGEWNSPSNTRTFPSTFSCTN